jgi:hypothetical protein
MTQILLATVLLTSIVAKNLVLDLILALQNKLAARILALQNRQGTLLRDLSSYISLVNSNNFDIISTIPLVDLVINNALDVDI